MKKLSLYALIFSIAFIAIYRIGTIKPEKEITWDILGYYIPLPATFIHHDPLLNSIDWLKKLNEEKHLAGTLYMVSSNDRGEPMYFFFLGMSFFYFPFFIIGHFLAFSMGQPMDGFSPPYQYSLVIGAIFYTIVGLLFFRKILLKFFSDKTTAIVILTTVFATNYIHHLTLINLEPVTILFMLMSIIIWYSIRWHEEQKLKYLIFIVASIALMALVKPSEVIVFLVPLFWNVTSIESFRNKWDMVIKNYRQFIIAFIIALIIVSPQIIYWYIKTGLPFYDTYKNPGVGLDFLSPHIYNVLFSFRKGWLLYTPVMTLYLLGFVFLYKRAKGIFVPAIIYFSVAFYIISSWSEWWYGAGFSIRPFITTYPILALGFGYLIEYIRTKSKFIKLSFAIVLLILIFLNQFQWWQFKQYIIHPFRTTKESYLATFLKTSITKEQTELFSIERDFSGKMLFNDKSKYSSRVIFNNNFESDNTGDKHVRSDSSNKYFHVDINEEFAFTNRFKYSELTQKDHLWFEIKYRYRKRDSSQTKPFLVITMDHKGNYNYYTFDKQHDTTINKWVEVKIDYLTPPIRNVNDDLLIYFWNRDKSSFDIDNFTIEAYEKKDKLKR